MGPFAAQPQVGPTRFEVDPETQLGVHYDEQGGVIEAAKHGTIRNTQRPRMTSHDGKQTQDGFDADANRD